MSTTEATPTILPSRKGSIGSTCNSVDDLATTPAVSEIGERSDLGNAGLTNVVTGERSANHSEFITLIDKVLKHRFHTCVPSRGNPKRDVKTRESQVETRVLCKIVNQLEKKFSDPETASSSALSHVSSRPVSIPSPGLLMSADSCLQPDTRNSCGISGNVSEELPAPNIQQLSLDIREVWPQHHASQCLRCRETCRASK